MTNGTNARVDQVAHLLRGLALLIACMFAGCGEPGGEPETPEALGPRANVLLVVVDTLRADILSPYGGSETVTPVLSRLADEGVLFEDCRAPSPWTLPSMASLFTGLYPTSHGAGLSGLERSLNRAKESRYGPSSNVPRRGQKAQPLPESISTMAEVFRDAGYRTYLRATNPFLRGSLVRGFDDIRRGNTSAATVVDWGLERLERHAQLESETHEQPFFMTLHFIDTHTNKIGVEDMAEELALFEAEGRPALGRELRNWHRYQDQPESFRPLLEDRRRMYLACTRYVDRQLGRMLDGLEAADLGSTYVLFTSDHGEDFRDHWEVDLESGHLDPRRAWKTALGVGHGHNLHQSVTHVPLVIAGPGLPAGKRVGQRVGLTDVLSTLCELTGMRAGFGGQGRSLVPLIQTEGVPPVAYLSESIAYGREKKAFYDPEGFLLIEPLSDQEQPQLFDLTRDPGEASDLSATRPNKVAELRSKLRRFRGALERRAGANSPPAESEEMDASDEAALRNLGYLGDE